MHRVIAILICILLVPAMAWGACGTACTKADTTYTCTDITYDCVNDAVTAASNGDTISLGAGDETWATGITTTKILKINGAGVNSTTITNGLTGSEVFLFHFTPDATARALIDEWTDTNTLEVSNIHFYSESYGSYIFPIKVTVSATDANPIKRVNIHDNKFTHYGTNPNLGGTCGVGNNCLKEVTTSALSLSAAETKTVEVIFQDTNVLNTGTPYYFMVHSSASANLVVMYDSTGVYANGVAYGTSSDASDWDLTGHNDDSYDLYFVIKKCN